MKLNKQLMKVILEWISNAGMISCGLSLWILLSERDWPWGWIALASAAVMLGAWGTSHVLSEKKDEWG